MPLSFRHQGINFRYEILGTGRPLVFCHGLTADLAQTRDLVGPVPPGWQLIVWDCRFHGATGPDTESEELNFATFASDLAALLDRCQIDSAVIGGISMGAGVAARFAVDHPARTRGLVLVRPAWTDHAHPPNLLLLEQIGARLAEMDPAELLRRFEADPSLLPAAQDSPAARETVRQMCMQPLARQRSLRLRTLPASAPVRPGQLRRLTMPTLIIGNDLDGLHPFSTAAWWACALGLTATLQKVPSKSLDMGVHQDAVRQHLTQFLARLAARAM